MADETGAPRPAPLSAARTVRALVVYAHPAPDSFCARLRDTVVGTLERCGHDVDLLDLHAEGFDPVLGAEATVRQRGGRGPGPDLDAHVRRLAAAEALVLVHPTWWSGQPAILKGWIDRVWPTGTGWHPVGPSPRPWQLRARHPLWQLRRLVVVTTHGSPRRVNLLQGEAGRLTVRRGLRRRAHPRARVRWVACYGIDEDRPARREAFVARVAREMARL